MSNYDRKLIITIPPELLLIGKAISRALDNDVGGAESWTPVLDGETITAYVADTPCTGDFYKGALYMLANPEALYQRCLDDYAARWTGLVPPTLEECQAFCAAVVLPVEPEPTPPALISQTNRKSSQFS